MHFTREPIIQTVITPRDGYKLTVRNSRGGDQEEYVIDALEVVSFGHSLFFRSLEKPKAFLLPVSDYEVIESKETRVILKNVSVEKAIKIGGGREASLRPVREAPIEKERDSVEERETVSEDQPSADGKLDKRRDRRRHRRRRSSEERHEMKEWTEKSKSEDIAPKDNPLILAATANEGGGTNDETISPVSSSMFSSLIPPPTTLISETIARYKDATFAEGALLSRKVEAEILEQEPIFDKRSTPPIEDELEDFSNVVSHPHSVDEENPF